MMLTNPVGSRAFLYGASADCADVFGLAVAACACEVPEVCPVVHGHASAGVGFGFVEGGVLVEVAYVWVELLEVVECHGCFASYPVTVHLSQGASQKDLATWRQVWHTPIVLSSIAIVLIIALAPLLSNP